MANKKVEPGHRVVSGNKAGKKAEEANATALDALVENGPYQPDMAPLPATEPSTPLSGEPEGGTSSTVQDAENASTGDATGADGQSKDPGGFADKLTLADLKQINTEGLEALAEERGVDISKAKSNDQRAELIFEHIQNPPPVPPDDAKAAPAPAKAGASAAKQEPQKTESASAPVVVLKKGATYAIGGYTFVKGKPAQVPQQLADRLLKTKYFVKG